MDIPPSDPVIRELTRPSEGNAFLDRSWNLGVQRQVTQSLFASATYVGTHIIHVVNAVELNPAIYIPGNCSAG